MGFVRIWESWKKHRSDLKRDHYDPYEYDEIGISKKAQKSSRMLIQRASRILEVENFFGKTYFTICDHINVSATNGFFYYYI